ncbi:MAG: hypothetical protein WDN69_01695 [Aliidongia sp.]
MKISDVVFAEDLQKHIVSRLSEKFIHVEGIRHRLANGRVIETDTYSRQFEYQARQVRQSLCLDISARRLLEDELRQSQKMEAVGQLTGGLAHDFNNVIGIVVGNLDILMEQLDPASLGEMELVGAAIGAALRGAELTKRLLAFSRQQALSPKVINLASLLQQTAHLLRRTLGEAITIDVRVADGICPVLVDSALLESAILNLAINARDAMPRGATLLSRRAMSCWIVPPRISVPCGRASHMSSYLSLTVERAFRRKFFSRCSIRSLLPRAPLERDLA